MFKDIWLHSNYLDFFFILFYFESFYISYLMATGCIKVISVFYFICLKTAGSIKVISILTVSYITMSRFYWPLLGSIEGQKKENRSQLFFKSSLSVCFVLPIICLSSLLIVDRFSPHCLSAELKEVQGLYICTGFLTHKFDVFHFHRDLSCLPLSRSLPRCDNSISCVCIWK